MSFYKPSKSAGARCLPACVYTHILLRIDEMPAIQQCSAASCCCYIKDRVAGGSNQFETKSLLPVYCNRCRAGRVVAGLIKHPQVSLSLSLARLHFPILIYKEVAPPERIGPCRSSIRNRS